MLGKVELNFRTKTELRALKVRLVCHEHTEWMGKESKSRTNLFKGNNDAFSTELILYGGPSGTTSLRRGQHFYHFNITLPHNLPGTFYCENGYINKIKAIVERPMAEDYADQIIFTIVPSIDLKNPGEGNYYVFPKCLSS
ncbi:hypothetical protein JTB14_014259 [Gonioctena quinquepunctata]|nr:hypothetical protein JTB14_014259 [Gonioctena quinquepunctata]